MPMVTATRGPREVYEALRGLGYPPGQARAELHRLRIVQRGPDDGHLERTAGRWELLCAVAHPEPYVQRLQVDRVYAGLNLAHWRFLTAAEASWLTELAAGEGEALDVTAADAARILRVAAESEADATAGGTPPYALMSARAQDPVQHWWRKVSYWHYLNESGG